jgi:hypothetical protein
MATVHKRRQTRLHSDTVQIELVFIKSVTIDDANVTLEPALSSVAVENVRDVTSLSPHQVNGSRDEIDTTVTSPFAQFRNGQQRHASNCQHSAWIGIVPVIRSSNDKSRVG